MKAADSAGNVSAVVSESITLANPPSVAVTSPANNSHGVRLDQRRRHGRRGDGRNPVGGLRLGGRRRLHASVTGTTKWSYALATSSLKNGSHTLSVKSVDAAGTSSPIVTVNINVQNVPKVSVASPANGATESGSLSISGTAAPESGGTLSAVSVSVDGGAYAAASGAANWSFALNTPSLPNGTHTVSILAVDTSGNSATASLSLNVQNIPSVSISNPGQRRRSVSLGQYHRHGRPGVRRHFDVHLGVGGRRRLLSGGRSGHLDVRP